MWHWPLDYQTARGRIMSKLKSPSHGWYFDKPAATLISPSPTSAASRVLTKKVTSRGLLLVSDDAAGRGGVERGIIEVARAMNARGWRAIVLVPGEGSTRRMCREAVLEVQLSRLYRRPRFWRVRRYLPPDVWLRNSAVYCTFGGYSAANGSRQFIAPPRTVRAFSDGRALPDGPTFRSFGAATTPIPAY